MSGTHPCMVRLISIPQFCSPLAIRGLSWIVGQCFIASLASLICSAVVSSFSDVLGVAQAKERATSPAPENLQYENLKERVERHNVNTELWWEEVLDCCVRIDMMPFPSGSSAWSGDGRKAETLLCKMLRVAGFPWGQV